MGQKNKTFPGLIYFLTLTVVDWVDIFTRPHYKHIIVDSLRYCQKEKDLVIYGWCLMSNHLHMIVSTDNGTQLSDILRDFKKFTSKKIVKEVSEIRESRRTWMLHCFKFAANHASHPQEFKFWRDGNEAKELFSPGFMQQKLDYIHDNPVRAEIVEHPEHYLFSSARNYAGKKGLLEVEFLI